MQLGAKIKKVYEKIGRHYTILRDTETITGEYCETLISTQPTKPFVVNFFMRGNFAYDASIVAGDIIEFDDGLVYMVVTLNPEVFKNQKASLSAVLYKCNVLFEIHRISLTKDVNGRVTNQGWSYIKRRGVALQTERGVNPFLDETQQIGLIENTQEDLYVPKHYGVEALDRVVHVETTDASGTITTSGVNVTGVGTLAETELESGYNIAIGSQQAVIDTVINDTLFTITAPLTTDIITGTVFEIDVPGAYYMVNTVRQFKTEGVAMVLLTGDTR